MDRSLHIGDLWGSNDPFKESLPQRNDTIDCSDGECRNPVNIDDLSKYTYLECMHQICNYCLRNYIHKHFVKSKGELQCPRKDCHTRLNYYQIREVMNKAVLN